MGEIGKISRPTRKGQKVIGRFKSLFAHWTRGLRRRLTGDSYHPEEHYMRGPGPKTRAKHSDRKSRS
ncbi:MAG: hypothetical protein EOR09_09420 [Mesorhizobium sp.]|nr:MAG: hypothetical protein EOR09_09420 [Mesorhizobium sp.]